VDFYFCLFPTSSVLYRSQAFEILSANIYGYIHCRPVLRNGIVIDDFDILLTQEPVTDLYKNMTTYIEQTIQNKVRPINLQRYRNVSRLDSIHAYRMPGF